MRRSVVALVLVLGALAARPDPAGAGAGRLRVCSVTINSDDEIRTFREHLPEPAFEFVELTELGPSEIRHGEPGWFRHACESGVRCDVLVVSGHFSDAYAGSFGTTFAGETGHSLALEALENRRCDGSCPGILEAPLEVFLFGCRTLADALESQALPPRDRELLERHGVSAAAAAEVLEAIRHRGEETSNERRMRFAFAGVPKIFGFSWTAPTGGPVAPLLASYFRGIGDYGAHLRGIERRRASGRDAAPNRELGRALRSHTFTATRGFRASDPELGHDAAACFLRSTRNPLGARLERSESRIAAAAFLPQLPAVAAAFGDVERGPIGAEERTSLDRIRAHEPTRAAVLDLVSETETPAIRLEALRIAGVIGWVAAAEGRRVRREIVLRTLEPPTYGEGRDLVCGIAPEALRRVDLRAAEVPPGLYGDEHGIAALACLRPGDPAIHARLAEALSDERPWIARAAANTLKAIKPSDVVVQIELARQLARSELDLRSSVEEALREIKPSSPEVLAAIREAAPSFPIDWF